MKARRLLIAAAVLTALTGWSGCRSGPEPARLFAEAEALRLRYEKEASQQAIGQYRQAMAAWERVGNKRAAAVAGQRIGATYEQLGSLHESWKSYEAALVLARESADRRLESEVRSNVGGAQGRVAVSSDAFDKAGEQCQVALEMAQRDRADREKALAFVCLGDVAYHRLLPERALGFYEEAGRFWDRLGDEAGQARASLLQGYVHSDLSRFDRAQACFERARLFWSAHGDKRQLALTLVADARLRVRRGHYQEALNRFLAALAVLEPMGDVVWAGGTLTGIARVYRDMGETRLALEYWERALRAFETAGLRTIAVDVLTALGETYLAAGDDTAALSRFERALTLADELGTQHWKAKALRFIGVIHLFRRQPSEARQYLDRSLRVQRSPGSSGDPRLRARTLADMGEACDLLREQQPALQCFRDALAISRATGDRVTEARGLFGLARAAADADDLDAARRHIERSLDVAESLRTEVESRDLRASYFASVYHYHEFHTDVLMRLHEVRPAEGLAAVAFRTSERARARSLLESLTHAGVDFRAGLDPDLLLREQAAKKAFDDWAGRRSRLATANTREAAALAEEYRDLEERYTQIQAEIRSQSPRYAALAKPQPLSLKEVQQQVLDADTVLLEYALGEERSYVWAVSHKDYASYELAPRATIEQAAQRVYERLTARLTATDDPGNRRDRASQADAEYWREATRLSEMLLGPVAKRLAGKRILVVADGALQYLPLAALPVPGRRGDPVPLIVEHEVVSLPSASVLAVLRRETRDRRPPDKMVAVLADPVFESDDPRLRAAAAAAASSTRGRLRGDALTVSRLAATRQEADTIIAAAPAGMTLKAIDFDASRATALSPALAQYRIVHFATHGVFDNENPGLSGVILSMFDKQGRPQDGFLRLHDIYNLHLPAELVVLSACNTALGQPVRGEGLVGIVRGFMYAGAKRVVASLWKVDDEATGELMGRFYREMLTAHRSPAAALRQAQIGMWQQDRWRPPFHWAAFVLQGEWK